MTVVSRFTPSAIAQGLNPPVSRYVWTLNGMSYGVIPEATLEGQTVSFDCKLTSLLSESAIVSHDSTEAIVFDPINGEIRIKRGSWYTVASGISFDEDWHSYSFGLSGVVIDSTVISSDTRCVSSISRAGNYSSTYATANIKNLKATGISNTDIYPSGTFNYKLDEPYSDLHIAVDSDNPDGVDVFNSGTIGSYGESVVLGLDDYHILSATGVNSGINSAYSLEVGMQYLMTFEIYDYVTGSIRIGDGDSNVGNFSGNGTYTALHTSGTNHAQIKRAGGATDLKVRGVTYKQTTAMQKFNDLAEDYTEEAV